MSRMVKEDLAELTGFLSAFSLRKHLRDEVFGSLLSQCHKRYFALLVFGAELSHAQPGSSSPLASEDKRLTFARNLYLQEFISDMGAALFSWSTGGYKLSKLSLRGALENLVKALSIPEVPQIISKTSVYEVFDTAADLKVFSDTTKKKIFRELRGAYAVLCADAHGASSAHMQLMKSLEYFPAFDSKKAKYVTKVYCDISEKALSLLSLSFKDIVLGMHYTNSDAIKLILPKNIKRSFYALDER